MTLLGRHATGLGGAPARSPSSAPDLGLGGGPAAVEKEA